MGVAGSSRMLLKKNSRSARSPRFGFMAESCPRSKGSPWELKSWSTVTRDTEILTLDNRRAILMGSWRLEILARSSLNDTIDFIPTGLFLMVNWLSTPRE